MSDVLRIDAFVKEVPVELVGLGNQVDRFILRELQDGDQRDKFVNHLLTKTKYDKEGKPAGVKNVDGLQSKLLAYCLFTPEGKPVGEAFIQKLPARVQNVLFLKAREISGLDENAEELAKNE